MITKADIRKADSSHSFGMTCYGALASLITLGSDGWVYSDASGKGRGEAFKVDVVDTTGAGDVFHGAFAYGMATGWDTRKSCEFAAAVAAIKCTKRGGRMGIPTLEQAMEFLEAQESPNWRV